MYINVESVEIETTDGKKRQTNSCRRDRGPSRKYLDSWTCSEEKDIKVCTAVAWQSLNKVNNIWKKDFAEKKGGSYSEQLRRQFSFTGVPLALWVKLIQECCKWW